MINIPKYQLSKTTIRQLIENISDGIETIIWDDYGYPNIMYVLNKEVFQRLFEDKFYNDYFPLDSTTSYTEQIETITVTQEMIDNKEVTLSQIPILDNGNFIFYGLGPQGDGTHYFDATIHVGGYPGENVKLKNGLTISWANCENTVVTPILNYRFYFRYRFKMIPGAFTVRDYNNGKYSITNIYENIYVSKYRSSLTDTNIPVSLPGALQDVIDLKDCEYIQNKDLYNLFPQSTVDLVTSKGEGWKVTNSLELSALKFLRSANLLLNRFKKITQESSSPILNSLIVVPNIYDAFSSNYSNRDLLYTMINDKKVYYNNDKNSSVKFGLKVPTVYDKIINIGWSIPLLYNNWFDTIGEYKPITPEILNDPPNIRTFYPNQYLFDSDGVPVMKVIDYTEQTDFDSPVKNQYSFYVDSTTAGTGGLRCRLIAEPLEGFYNIFKNHPYYNDLEKTNLDPMTKLIDMLNSDLTKHYPGIVSALTKLEIYNYDGGGSEGEVLLPLTVEFIKNDGDSRLTTPINVFIINKPISGLYDQDIINTTDFCTDAYSFFNEYSIGIHVRKYNQTIDGETIPLISLCPLRYNTTGSIWGEGFMGNRNLIVSYKYFNDEKTGNNEEFPYLRYIDDMLKNDIDLTRNLLDIDSTGNMFPITISSLNESIYPCANYHGSGWQTFAALCENYLVAGVKFNLFNTTDEDLVLPKSFQNSYQENMAESLKKYYSGNSIYWPFLFKNNSIGMRYRNERFFPENVYINMDSTAVSRPLTMVKVDSSPLGWEFKPVGLDLSKTYIDENMTIPLSDCLINSTDKYMSHLIKLEDPIYYGFTGINAFENTQPDATNPDSDPNGYFYFTKQFSNNDYFKYWCPLHECQGLVDIPHTLVTYRMTYIPGNVVNTVVDDLG